MADTNPNGATAVGNPGVNIPGPGGSVAGAGDPFGVADAGLAQARSALQALLVPTLSAAVRKHTPKLRKALEGLVGNWLDEAVAKPGIAPGRDPAALRDEWKLVLELKARVPELLGLARKIEDTILVRSAEVWTAVLAIYGVAGHVPDDPKVRELFQKTAAALSPGPRKQTVKHAKLARPIPHGKKALHNLALANADGAPEVGTPGSTVTPSSQAAPAPAGPVPASGAPASNGNSGTPSSGHTS